jgi:hypothetical protein
MSRHLTAVLFAKESPQMRTNRSVQGRESGFALVLALLALLLLTFLGLTLAVTTSTELQIATNYRWSEQSRYVAEAGIEAGKIMLRETISWENLLPAPRSVAWIGNTAPGGPLLPPRVINGVPIRDWENWECDNKGQGVGYGRVLDWNGVPQQYVGTFGSQTLSGGFTLWVRRPLHYLPSGGMVDWGGALSPPVINATVQADNNNLILVAEGMAPFTTMVGAGAMAGRTKAVHVIEVALSKNPPVLGGCDNPLSGQQGQGPGGANFGGCEKMGEGSMEVAVAGSTSSGGLGDTAAR